MLMRKKFQNINPGISYFNPWISRLEEPPGSPDFGIRDPGIANPNMNSLSSHDFKGNFIDVFDAAGISNLMETADMVDLKIL